MALAAHAEEVLTNHFLVKVDGGHEMAHRIAKRHGFVNLGPVRLIIGNVYYLSPYDMLWSNKVGKANCFLSNFLSGELYSWLPIQ